METFRSGDRVCSRVAGKYLGLPGTIRNKAQWQYNLDTRYNIDLDCGVAITLHTSQIAYYS